MSVAAARHGAPVVDRAGPEETGGQEARIFSAPHETDKTELKSCSAPSRGRRLDRDGHRLSWTVGDPDRTP